MYRIIYQGQWNRLDLISQGWSPSLQHDLVMADNLTAMAMNYLQDNRNSDPAILEELALFLNSRMNDDVWKRLLCDLYTFEHK